MNDYFDVTLEVKEVAEDGTFEGYGAVFGNLDRDGDIVKKGAFSKSLKTRVPALLWQHNQRMPVGKFEVVKEDKTGVFVKGRLAQKGQGEEALELLRMGAVTGLSIGFITRKSIRDEITGQRTILEADLMEISIVTFPANEEARITAVKAAGMSIRELELKLTQDAGFSRTVARKLINGGYKSLQAMPGAGSNEETKATESVTQWTKSIKNWNS